MTLSKEQKREAASKFKEKKIVCGVYAVRCAGSGQVWVGASRNVDATRNGIWFSLRIGAHRDRFLNEAWKAQSGAGFEYEVLEALDEDVHPMAVGDLLKHAKARWVAELQALPLL